MRDFVLKNGRVINPSAGLDVIADVYVTSNGRIAGIGAEPAPEVSVNGGNFPEVSANGGDFPEQLEQSSPHRPGRCDRREWFPLDVTGCVVTPGLVDCHVHAYEHATPLGINVDATCLARAVTAVVDAGSAGSSTLPGLLEYVGKASHTRLYCLVHIARQGLADAGCVTVTGGGECDSLKVVDVEACAKAIMTHRDRVVGVKVRLAKMVADEGRNEAEAFRRALKASGECKVPLMVHHSISSIAFGGQEGLCCPGDLRPGDIFTHCFHGQVDNIVDRSTGRVNPHVWEAKRRGVLFDVGHGQGSFSWRVAEQCASEGFWPDTISTDLHTGSLCGPAYDLVAVMSKMLHLGMPFMDVIRAVTITPVTAIGKDQELGHLAVGRQADISVLRLEDVSQDLEDSEGEMRTLKKAFVPVRVFVAGREFPVKQGMVWPNQESVNACRERTAQFRAAQSS